jgi:N-acetylglucosaminyl-diphospho-decaprenol L-rhamnosyltransferase
VTIADNASREEEREKLRAADTPASLELFSENLGYGAAANRVLAGGSAELVCVSNADIVPEPGALEAMVRAVREDPAAGMVGPVFGGPTDSYHARLPGAATMLGRIFAGSFGSRRVRTPSSGETVEVGQPSGACFVMRRPLWESVGGFDEEFFLWYEDVDLAKRLSEAGRRNLVCGAARVHHLGAEAFEEMPRESWQAVRLPSVELYIRKHHPAAHPLARPLLWLSAKLRAGGRRGG